MTRSLLTEFYLQNSHKFEYLGTGATDFVHSRKKEHIEISKYRCIYMQMKLHFYQVRKRVHFFVRLPNSGISLPPPRKIM